MIGPVSTTGRTMMASLQQAIQKGMPPDQAIQYVKSMATQGVAPLADLYAMMNQFQRLKQQPVQPPQTPPTIRDQLNMAEQQQAMMQQGVASLPAPTMEQAQFAGGGIVAFSGGGTPYDVEGIYERGKTGDGFDPRKLSIFAERANAEDLARLYALSLSQGDVDTASRLEPYLNRKGVSGSQLNEIRRKTAQGIASVQEANRTAQREAETQQFLTGRVAPPPSVAPPAAPPAASSVPPAPSAPPAPPAPPSALAAPPRRPAGLAAVARPAAPSTTQSAQKEPTREEMEDTEFRRIQDFRRREGLGAAREEMRQFLSEENKRLAEQFGRDKMLAFAEAGFKMAAAASRPGATFLGALSEGAISGTQALRGLNKEMDANRRGLREATLKLRQAEELEKEGDFKTAMQIAQQARTEMFERQKHADAMNMDARRLEVMVRGQNLDFEGRRIAAAASRGQSGSQAGAIGADDLLRIQHDVLKDRIKDERETIQRLYDVVSVEGKLTDTQQAAYNRAIKNLNALEAQRSSLAGLSGGGGGGGNVIDWNSLPK